MELKGTKTEKNLMEAFAGESMARSKYTFFASKAKKDGYVKTMLNRIRYIPELKSPNYNIRQFGERVALLRIPGVESPAEPCIALL